jgi:hypothetical protein
VMGEGVMGVSSCHQARPASGRGAQLGWMV